MTPQPARAYPYPRATAHEAQPRATIKAEVMKYMLAIVVAGLTSYFATIYAIKEEVAVLKVHVEYLRKAEEKQTKALDDLARSVNAHMLVHHKVAP